MPDHIGTMCGPCAAGMYEECRNPQPTEDELWIIPCAYLFAGVQKVDREPGEGPGRKALDPSEITDAKSTGRKRAAMVMPILTGQLCGWSGLKFAGGGVVPIVGCQGNTIADVKSKQQAVEKGADEVGHRHHGPDKNTLNNSPGVNLHGICTICHTRWHALNNEFYEETGRPDAEFPFTPVEAYYLHDPVTSFTEEEWAVAEAWWSVKDRFERGPYPFTPPEGTKMALPLSVDASTLTEGNPFPDSPLTIGDIE